MKKLWPGKWACRAPNCKYECGDLRDLLVHQREKHPGVKTVGSVYLGNEELKVA